MLALRVAIIVSGVLAPMVADAAGRPVVLELFTSEGCSSCPPAERLLSQLAGQKDLLPLAFHVTYWNSLGWRDPYSFDGATQRQAAYAARLGGGSYTPEMVVDGRQGMVGSEDGEVAQAIASARRSAVESVPVTLVRAGGSVKISVGKGAGRGKVLLVGYDPHHRTQIGRGENSGLTLSEANVVRSFRAVGDYAGRPIDIAVPAGAGSDVAVLIQAPDGRIIGAARA